LSQEPIHNILFTDADVNGPAIEIAREMEVEIVRAADVELRKAADPVIFQYAFEHQYILVTGNIQDFAPMLKEWLETGEDHPGIIYITKKHRTNSQHIAEMMFLYASMPMTNRSEYI
jgi:hypothetical protein